METFFIGIGIVTCICLAMGLVFCVLMLIYTLKTLKFADERLRARINNVEDNVSKLEDGALRDIGKMEWLETEQSKILKRHGEDMERVLTKINALEKRQRKLIDLDIWVDRLRERVTTLEKGS